MYDDMSGQEFMTNVGTRIFDKKQCPESAMYDDMTLCMMMWHNVR
jgi:hypothetical protein